jgi:ABC-type uncharacterized transport system involved in gliding motility auxiliary subunit
MDCVDPDLDLRVIDPRFFAEWVAFGMLELAVYLTRYAEFEATASAAKATSPEPGPSPSTAQSVRPAPSA